MAHQAAHSLQLEEKKIGKTKLSLHCMPEEDRLCLLACPYCPLELGCSTARVEMKNRILSLALARIRRSGAAEIFQIFLQYALLCSLERTAMPTVGAAAAS